LTIAVLIVFLVLPIPGETDAGKKRVPWCGGQAGG
jgi:hypothetical protein